MGTYDDSQIRTARKAHACVDPRHTISAGERYLDYRLGQRWSVRVCLECALKADCKYQCWALDDLRDEYARKEATVFGDTLYKNARPT